MKKIFIGMTAFAMIMATSCVNEELIDNQQTEKKEFTLNVSANANSRTLMADNGIVWGEIGEEAVYVFSESKKTYGILYLVEVKDEGKTATFTGGLNGFEELKYVVYPAPIVNGNNIPAPDDLKINMDKINGENHNAPMYGTITSGHSELQNAGGLVKFEIKGVDSDEAVSFSGTVTKDGVSTPVTGGFYTFESGKLIYHPVQDSKTIITGFPESGIVYLPVAIEEKYQSKDQAPKANITATLHNEVPGGQVLTTVNDIPLSKGDVAYQEVPTFNIVKDAGGQITKNDISQWIDNNTDLNSLASGSYKLSENLILGQSEEIIITNNNNVIIDLNGYNITSNYANVFVVLTGSTLTINGDDKSQVIAGPDSGNAVWAKGGTVIINGGYYKASTDNNGYRNDCIYAGYNENSTYETGLITINGGKFEFTGEYIKLDKDDEGHDFAFDGDLHLLNCADSDANPGQCQITVNGGKFKNHVPSYEPYAISDEVVLGTNKKVYFWDMDTATIGQEIKEKDYKKVAATWYIVK